MPFGFTNTLTIYQKLLNQVLSDALDKNSIIYFNDIFIYSKTEEKHIKYIQHILQKLQKHDLKVESKKCFFHKNKMEFLGYQVGIHEIIIKPNKIRRIFDWFVPTIVKKLQEFFRFINFNQQFIENYSKCMEPLTSMTKKDIIFKWK